MTTPRVGVIGLWHETNTFSATSTTMEDFRAFEMLAGAELAEHNIAARTVIGGFLHAPGLDPVPVFAAGAWPSGPTDEAVLDQLLERVEEGLRRAGPLDGVLVNLHGAMVSRETADVEMAVVAAIRDAVGDLPLGAVLDLHANPSPELAAATDVLVSYDTFPHVDMYERGLEVADLLGAVIAGRELRTAVRKVPILVSPVAQSTSDGPLGRMLSRASARGRAAGLARVSVVGGFAYSDVDRAGMSVLAIHDVADESAARSVLDETIADVIAHAAEFDLVRDDPATAVTKALASTRRPVFLVDVADNVGGGSPGDGTALLQELLHRGARDVVAIIADREVATLAHDAGEGNDIEAWLGGKTDKRHGEPIRAHARVLRVTNGTYRSAGYYMTGQTFSMGTTAVLDLAGNTIVVTERPTPPFHSEQLTSQGVDPGRARIVIVKGALAWREAFRGVPGEVIEVATPGICPIDVSLLPRRTVPISV